MPVDKNTHPLSWPFVGRECAVRVGQDTTYVGKVLHHQNGVVLLENANMAFPSDKDLGHVTTVAIADVGVEGNASELLPYIMLSDVTAIMLLSDNAINDVAKHNT